MCYQYGSIDQAVNVCPMCKVFPHARCPHVRDVCRNRALHPRFDVLYMKNAEVDSFNGCGYCKWARTNPSPKHSGYNNPGWPGCCRPPLPTEYRLIQAADWRSVSIVHHVPIPADIKAALDSLSIRTSPVAAGVRGTGNSKPTMDRKNSGHSSPSSRANSLSGKTAALSIKGRSGGSPQQLHTTLNSSRISNMNPMSSSVPNSSVLDQNLAHRRQPIPDFPDRRLEGVHSSHSSPSRKHIDLENSVTSHSFTTPRRVSSVRRPTISPATTSIVSADSRSPSNQTSVQRRASLSNSKPSSATPPADPRSISITIPRSLPKDEDNLSSASSSSGSSDGMGSLSDSTVTSDGGFTDYLSDESEAELQRQAEARAALVAQNQAEELEFKAARQQLAHVDLRPPKTWNPTNITNSTAVRTGPAGPTTTCSPRRSSVTSIPANAMAHVGKTHR